MEVLAQADRMERVPMELALAYLQLVWSQISWPNVGD